MVQRYFEKFPLTEYTSNVCIDITKRTGLLEKISSNPLVFYPYELDSYERPDQLSHRYYNDQYKSWLIYLTNKIVDPYYEWYLTDDEFEQFITKKYGSVDIARKKVKFFRNDWANKEQVSVSGYNSFTSLQKTYWEPIYGINNGIVSYKRKQRDWITNTNKLISYKVSNTDFKIGELCKLQFDNYNEGYGKVDVVSVIDGTIYLNNVSGTYDLKTPAEEIKKITTSESFLGDGSKTAYVLMEPLNSQNNCIITVDGLVQVPGLHYIIVGNTLQFTTAPVNNALIEYRHIEIDLETYESQVIKGNGYQIGFILSSVSENAESLLVTVDGLIQIPNINYQLVAGQIRFSTPPAVDSVVEIRNISFEYIFSTTQYSKGDGITTNFAQNEIVLDQNDLLVTVDGLLQIPNIHYTASNRSVVFASPPIVGSNIEFRNIIRKTIVKGYIYGVESGTNAAFSSIRYLANNIPQDVEVYYKGVTYYEYEFERNEYNKSIRLLDNRYASQASNELKELMSE